MIEWKPISTAPKNGTYHLVYHPEYGRAVEGYWSDDFREWRRNGELYPQPLTWTELLDPNKSTLQSAMKSLKSLTNEERMELWRDYCTHCGSDDPKCQCWNDE
jgi:hypothetical protein